jgi:APA family basic amino acid/polyamine antiporter
MASSRDGEFAGRGNPMPDLKRELGLFETTVYGVGLILGAGIYAILGEAAGVAGESLPVSFLLAAVIATLTGLSYAELSSRFPKGEGDYIYVREAFGSKRLSEFAALLRIFMGVISAAAVAIAFAGYLSGFVTVPVVPAALAIVALSSVVNYWGIDFSAKVNVLFTAIEVLGLLVVVWLGAGTWGSVDVFEFPTGGVGLVEASFLVFFAYLGFGSIVNVAEETRDATRTVPRAIVLAIAVTTLLYVAVGLSAVGLVAPETLGASSSPLAVVAAVGWGPAAFTVVAVIALFSTTNTVLILLVSTSRLLYGVSKAEYRSFPTVFSRVHPERRTPHFAVAAIAALTVPFVLLGDLGLVAGLANLVLLVAFTLVNAALLRLRFRDPTRPGFRAPLNVGRLSLTALGGLVSSVLLALFYLGRLSGVV